MVKYFDYTFRRAYKVLPPNAKDIIYVSYSTGANQDHALRNLDFWAETPYDLHDNLIPLSVERKLNFDPEPLAYQKLIKTILSMPKEEALEIINSSTLEDIDKIDLTTRVNSGKPFDFLYMDTYLRDQLYKLFEKEN